MIKESDTRPSFNQLLQAKWDAGKFVCVGLDPEFSKLPQNPFHEYEVNDYKRGYMTRQLIFERFLQPIIDATADLVCAYKPNLAFYEFFKYGHSVLSQTIDYIHKTYPDIPVIGDGKRADIGNTNTCYARMAFDPSLGGYSFDAMTTNPYFGHGTYKPFLSHTDKGLIALCKTSNPDASMYQNITVDLEDSVETGAVRCEECEDIKDRLDGKTKIPFYHLVAYRHGRLAESNPNIGIVVGATHPEAFAPVRRLYGNGTLLIPGIGKQGGDLEATLKYAPNSKGQGMVINSSSAIIFASNGEDFADAARAATLDLHQKITVLRGA